MNKEHLLCVAQCGDDKLWYMGYAFHNMNANQWYLYCEGMALPVPVLEYTISRCIGIRDSMNDLIFEGCIVDASLQDGKYHVRGIIKWDDYACAWGFMVRGGLREYFLQYFAPEELTICGHIHVDYALLREMGYQDDGSWDDTKDVIIDLEEGVRRG